MIIGFTGPAGVGKSTAAQLLESCGWVRVSFADPLRRLARRIHPEWGPEHFGADRKDQTIPALGYSPRWLLRTLGDEINSLCPEAVTRALARELDRLDAQVSPPESARVCIDDVRYPHEAALIRARGGVVVHLQRPRVEYRRDHETEYLLPMGEGDQVVTNAGHLRHLTHELVELLQHRDSQA